MSDSLSKSDRVAEQPPNTYQRQMELREQAEKETRRYGFEPGLLQWLWRGRDCFTRKYDSGEVIAAICDALTREGQTAWPGDGTSCVEQMIRLQWDRAEKAEAEVARLKSVSLSPTPPAGKKKNR